MELYDLLLTVKLNRPHLYLHYTQRGSKIEDIAVGNFHAQQGVSYETLDEDHFTSWYERSVILRITDPKPFAVCLDGLQILHFVLAEPPELVRHQKYIGHMYDRHGVHGFIYDAARRYIDISYPVLHSTAFIDTLVPPSE